MKPTKPRPDVLHPSDLSAEQFEVIRPFLQSARKKTSPRQVNLHHVFNAVVYLLREGCRWRSLPRDFPDWRLCYYYFRIWRDPIDKETGLPLLEVVLKKLVSDDRTSNGRDADTTMLIIDAQSVKNTDPAEQKGYDGGKKVSGIKRHLAVDSRGLPHQLHVTTANISDKAGAMAMLRQSKEQLQKVTKLLVDGGYNGKPFADFSEEPLGVEVEVAKRNELHAFAVIPKRWVVERSISWLEKCRRLWKNCERKLHTSLAMLHAQPSSSSCSEDFKRVLSKLYTDACGHRSMDILHVATAIELGAAEFLTFDGNQKN